jgi:hypothetical protein
MTQPTTTTPSGRHASEGAEVLSAAGSFTEGVEEFDLTERIERALHATGYGRCAA